ncbi:MAG: hypothetical protein HON90_03325 [Halobacteriovoraceae bacterium]|jgi:hypothetical protein|nr:hypothetical protein [Halobacteriovoraceae bacterium]
MFPLLIILILLALFMGQQLQAKIVFKRKIDFIKKALANYPMDEFGKQNAMILKDF